MNGQETIASGIVGEGNGSESTEEFYEEESDEEFFDSQPYFEEESDEIRLDLIRESTGVGEIEIIESEIVHESGGEIEMVGNETHQVGGEIEMTASEAGNQSEGGDHLVIEMVNNETSNHGEEEGGVATSSTNGTLPLIGGAFLWFRDKGSIIFTSLIVCVLGQVVCSGLVPWYTNYRPATPPPPAFVFPLSPSPAFPPSLPPSGIRKYHGHALIIVSINFALSGLALLFIWLTLAWKEKRLNERVGIKDIFRFVGHFVVFVVRFALVMYAVVGGRLKTIDLTGVPLVMELISNFLEMYHEAQQPKLHRLASDDPVNCFGFILLLMLTLTQGTISASLPWTNNQSITFTIVNCVLAALMLVIAVCWFYLKFRRNLEGSMKEKMRIIAYSIVLGIRVGILIYAVIAKSHGLIIYNFDLSCFPFLCELYVIYLELKSPPVRLPTTH